MVRKFKYLILTGIILTGIFNDLNGQEEHSYQNLSPEEFYVKMNQNVSSFLIDARLKPDYEFKRIHGAQLASGKDELISLVDTLSKDTPIFVYCYDGDRSKTACKILTRQLNFSRVYNLKKGLEMWEKMDFPVEKTE